MKWRSFSGRSGTLCLIDSCQTLLEKDDSEPSQVSNPTELCRMLLDMRRDRQGLVQTWQQLQFAGNAVRTLAARIEANITAKEDGRERKVSERKRPREEDNEEEDGEEAVENDSVECVDDSEKRARTGPSPKKA